MKPINVEHIYRVWFAGVASPIEVRRTTERGYGGIDEETWLPMYHLAATTCGVGSGSVVLDAGCGSGYGADHLASIGCKVTAIDVSDEAVRYARLCAPEASVLQCTLEQPLVLPVPFDAVVAIESVEHVQNDSAMFAEFHRVLRPGGVLFLSTPDSELFDRAHAEAYPEAPQRAQNPFHVREYVEADLRALLEHTGFTHVARVRTPQPQYSQALCVVCWKP